MEIGEYDDGEDTVCAACGARTALIYPVGTWAVDPEPFRDGEEKGRTEEEDEIPDEVDVDAEVSAHYCLQCGKITSLSFNQA